MLRQDSPMDSGMVLEQKWGLAQGNFIRAAVGLEGLVTYKYKLVGNGHIVQDYSGTNAKKFTHRPILET